METVCLHGGRLFDGNTLIPNEPADIVVIDTEDPWVGVSQTWVGGKCVFQMQNRRENHC